MKELYNSRKDNNIPLISVIIPVYNTCHYLSQCLRSISSQTYKNIEIIIVDDGSTDTSGVICDRFAKDNNKACVLHTENCGLAAARNKGIEKAEGSFLFFLDSDDWVETGTVETLLKNAVKHEADIVCARSCSEYVGQTVSSKPYISDAQSFQGEDILSAFADGLFSDTIWNKLYHRNCFDSIRFPEGHNHEDLAVTWRLLKNLAYNRRKVVAIPDILFHRRMRRSSISNTRSIKNLADQWEASIDKYEGLSEYREKLVSECISVIGSMWIHYWNFTREDRIFAESVIEEMQHFSKRHLHQIMRGSYPIQIKIRCVASQSSASIVLWACHAAGKVWKALRNKRYRMFE